MTADTGDGTAWIVRLRKGVGSGVLVELAPGIADEESDPPGAGEALSARELPAEDIRALLLEPGLRTDPRGLQIRGALVTGTLDLDYAKLPCRLVFSHCRFENAPSFKQATMPGLVLAGVALPGLSLHSARLTGDCDLTGLRSTGEVTANGIDVGGQLDLRGAKLSNPGEFALALDGADITGNVLMGRLETKGGVRAPGARFGGQLDLSHAKLSNPDKFALYLDGADVTGNVMMSGLEAKGQVRASGVHIHGQLILFNARLHNPSGVALNLTDTTLYALRLDEKFTVKGGTDFYFASIRILSVGWIKPAQGLPPLKNAHGWTLSAIHGFLLTDRRSAREWLDTIGTNSHPGSRREFFSQPWMEMAKIYDQIGQPEDARRLRFWAAQRTTRVAPWTSKLVRWPYAALVGYGYYPLIVLGWLAGLWLTVLVLATLNAPDFTPTEARASTVSITTNNRSEEIRVTGATPSPPNYPQFDPRLYAMDTAIPAAPTGQSNAWRITGNTWLPGVFAAIKGFAWLLAALLLAGITGILRKD